MTSVADEQLEEIAGADLALPTVGALTRLVSLAFRERVWEAVKEAGYDDLQPAHVFLFRYPTIADLRPGELATQLGISKQAVNDLLRQLEARGYLTLRPDPSDGRARLITLTDRGEEVVAYTRQMAQEISAEWARAVGRKRYEAFRQTLLDILDACGRTPPPL